MPSKTVSPPPAPSPQKEKKTPPPRLYDLSLKRSDMFEFDPLMLEREPGFNSRDDWGDLNALADDIHANGQQQPFVVRKEAGGDRIFLVDGDRRWTAITTILIPAGRWPQGKGVRCIPEGVGVTPLDRIFKQLSLNNGKPFTLLEKSIAYQKAQALDPDLTGSEIARRTGETKQTVSDILKLGKATEKLLAAIRQHTLSATAAIDLIKQSEKTGEDQDALLEAAINSATEKGRDHVTPRDFAKPTSPTETAQVPPKAARLEWTYDYDLIGASLGFPEDIEPSSAPHVLRLTGLPDGVRFAFGWEFIDGRGFNFGYYFADENKGTELGWRFTPDTDGPAGDELESSLFNPLQTVLLDIVRRDGLAMAAVAPLVKQAELKVKSEAPSPWDIADLAKSLEAPAPLSRAFIAYTIPDAPPEPNKDGTYEETDRLVLEERPAGIERLHLITAMIDGQPAYGYRIQAAGDSQETTFLPRADHRLTNSPPISGFFAMLAEALASVTLPAGSADQVNSALKDAIARYWPEEDDGTPEEPLLLAYVRDLGTAAKGEPGAIERIKNSGSTNRDGSGVALGNDGKFVDPSKRLEQLNQILEELADGGDEARTTTANLVYNFLMNETSPATLKDHLKGK